MSFLQIIELVIKLMPLIRDAIAQAETLFPAGGSGATKLDYVKTMIQSAINTVSPVSTTFDAVWNTVAPLIELMVPSIAPKVVAATTAVNTVASSVATVASTPSPSDPSVVFATN